MKINEADKIYDLKQEYVKSSQYQIGKIRIRFFFGGAELKDENEIFKYKIKDGYTIQVNIIEID
jgi:hypothetical protein